MRYTGFPPAVKREIFDRSGGRCEVGAAGCTLRATAFHHRRPRAAGGTRRPDTNSAANGLAVCDACHRFIESHRTWALARGFLLRQTDDPATVPVRKEVL